MSGSVDEWLEPNWFDGDDIEQFMPMRGGAWNKPAQDCRSAAWDYQETYKKSYSTGIRLVRCTWLPDPEKYRYHNERKSFDDAKAECAGSTWPDESVGGHLVVINNSAENSEVLEIRSLGSNMWIGYSDAVEEGVWVWEPGGGGSTYTHWNAGEPSGGAEDCAEMRADGTWNDVRCYYTKPFLCEKDD